MSEQALKDEIAILQRKVEVLTHLAEISAALNSRVHLEPLLQQIMDVSVEICECESASVLLWNHRTHELFFAASTSNSVDDLIGKPVPMDSIGGAVLRDNTIIQVDDAKSDPRHYKKTDEEIQFETRSLLGVPMTYRDRAIGVLEAINKKQLPWTEDDRHYLTILASQAAVAIEGAQLVMELKRANEELAELDKLKNDFIAIASHELRTPLGVIMGYASFLQEETSESAQEHAGKVLESALKLRQIIEDMVNLRYLKQKQSDLHIENLSLRDLIHGLEREQLALVDPEKHDVRIELPDEDLVIRADQTRLSMAIANLLNNAFSFTPSGGRVTIRAEAYSDREVWLSIIDTGVGLEADKLERIFEEFYQIEDHMTRHHGGLGIGLSIAQAIVRAHGGRIWADSEGLGKGTTFTMSLPLAKSE